MPESPTLAGYTTQEVASLTGLSTTTLRKYVAAGWAQPRRGPGGSYRFSFTDLSRLRAVAELAPRLRQQLGRAMHRIDEHARIAVEDGTLVVRDHAGIFEPGSGQGRFDFTTDESTPAEPLFELPPPPDHLPTALAHARQLERRSPVQAEAVYRQMLEVDDGDPPACINLGRLLHLRGELESAIELYERALQRVPDEATALFNLAVAYEDLEQPAEALRVYERVIAADPNAADAYLNAARLCEKGGDQLGALRHLRRYRALRR